MAEFPVRGAKGKSSQSRGKEGLKENVGCPTNPLAGILRGLVIGVIQLQNNSCLKK